MKNEKKPTAPSAAVLDAAEEARLIQKAQDADANAAEALLAAYKSVVVRQAQSLHLPGAQREDLIQEGMIGLYRAILTYREEEGTSFAHYARLCARRRMLSAIQAANRQKNAPLNFYTSLSREETKVPLKTQTANSLEASRRQAEALSPEERLIDLEKARMLWEMIYNALSPLEKKVFLLTFTGHSHTEIAERLQKPKKSIDNALQRIRKKMKGLTETG